MTSSRSEDGRMGMPGYEETNDVVQTQLRRGRKRRRSPAGGIIGILVFMLVAGLLGAYSLKVFPFKESPGNPTPPVTNEIPGGAKAPEDVPGNEGLVAMEKALQARGLYVTMDVFGTPSRFTEVITFARENAGLNSFVVVVMDNNGRIPCEPESDMVIPAKPAAYKHFSGLVNVLDQDGYYLIARIVAFQDPYMARGTPEQAIRNADGSLWKDRDGRLWLNPYDKRNWEFIRDISLWACEMGFHEIQLDYVRFPDSASGLEKSGVLMPGHEEYESRGDAIFAFLEYMSQALDGKAYLSADVFGFVTIAQDDMGIGQKLEQLADSVDFICPMVYPSHYYNAGIYGFQVPEAHPYEVVYKAMDEAIERTEGLKSKIRPWLQDFSMRIKYGPSEVQGQIDAVYDHEIETFLVWNPANIYTENVKYVKSEPSEQ
jgi:hypothetical protein